MTAQRNQTRRLAQAQTPVGVIAVTDLAPRTAYLWAVLRSRAIDAPNVVAGLATRVPAFRRLAPARRAEAARTPADLMPSVKLRDEMIRQGLFG